MSYLPGKFIWFEHVSNDVQKARKFYGELFGWSSDPVPMGEQPYHLIQNRGQGIGGFRTAMPGMPNHWMSYLSVPDVDASARAAQAAGAKVLMPPTDFAPVGRGATIADPTGAVLSVWKSVEGDPADAERAKALGAQLLVSPRDIPEVGRFTVLMDPTGAVIAAIRGRFTG